jgi:hypothetical protein
MLCSVRVRAKWTPRAGLLWVLAFVVAGALAYCDWSMNGNPEAPRAGGGEPSRDHADEDVTEIEVIYGDGEPTSSKLAAPTETSATTP